jgi:hypothetical protein
MYIIPKKKSMRLFNYFEVISAGVVSGLLIRRLIRSIELLNQARKQRAAMYRHVNKENYK